jgi:hypothetical protein
MGNNFRANERNDGKHKGSEMKEISFFSVPDINKADDYVPFRNVRIYIKSCSEKFRNKHELLLKVGYSKKSYSKFCNRESDWLSLRRNIPLKYLFAIGAELQQIEVEVDADRGEYLNVLKLSFYLKNAVVRVMAAVFFQYKFKPGTTESEAIEIMRAYSKEKHINVCINYPGVKSIWIQPDGASKISYYFPSIRITKKELVPFYIGDGVGKSYLA